MTERSQLDSAILAHFLVGFEGTSLAEEFRKLLRGGLAGIVIFPRNWTTPEALLELTQEIRRVASRPVLVGIDAEPGGRFALPEPFTQWPTAQQLGALDDPALGERVACVIGRELRAVGVNLCFAPMLDLHVHPESPVTRERSFGADPHRVGRLGAAVHRGLAAAGVLSCAKHFPGHGDALIDPHEDLPVFHGDARRLDGMELVPFIWAIEAGAPLVMTAHILLPRIDPQRPASLSRKLLVETLRGKMGFEGVIVADDIGMGAIRKRCGPGEAAIQAILAGTDLVAICHDWSAVEPAIEAVGRALGHGLFLESEWQASAQRIEWIRQAVREAESGEDAVGLETVGCAGHKALAEEIRARLA